MYCCDSASPILKGTPICYLHRYGQLWTSTTPSSYISLIQAYSLPNLHPKLFPFSSHSSHTCIPNHPCNPCQRRGHCISVCLSVDLSLRLFVCTEHECFSPQPLVWLSRNVHHRSNYSCSMFIDNCDVIGHVVWQPCWKKGKTWPQSPKPLHVKNWNLAHVKYSPWETS